MKKAKLLILLFAILIPYFSNARDIYFKHISTLDGLSQLSTISIWQDGLGNMWFGNDVLNKYDGNSIKIYRLSEYIQGIQDINIKKICGNKQSMYVLASTEIIAYDALADQFIQLGLEAECIYYKDNKLYFGQKNKVYVYDPEIKKAELLVSLASESMLIRDILPLDNEKIWIGTTEGLFLKERETQIKDIISKEYISCLFQDSHKNIWIGTLNNGIRIINAETNKISVFNESTPLSPQCRLYNNRIRCINEDDKQNIWIGTYGGITLCIFDNHLTAPYQYNSSSLIHSEYDTFTLRHNSIYSIYKDSQGTMWIGSYYGGVNYFNPSIELYTYYPTSQINKSMLNGFIIGNMIEDNNENLYIATEEGGINKLNRHTGSIKRFDKESGFLPNNTIKSIWFDKENNRLFAGAFNDGLFFKDPDTDYFKPIGENILTSTRQKIISQILPYNEKYILILTQDGVFQLDRKSLALKEFSDVPDLNYKNYSIIQNIHITSDSILWVSSVKEGIFCINLKTKKRITFDKLDIDTNQQVGIIKILSDLDGNIYLLAKSGLFIYNNISKTFRSVNKGKNALLLSNAYYNMALTPSGKIIITSDKGVTLYDPAENKSEHLPFAKVLPLSSINSNCGLYVSSSDNNIFIGAVGGMLFLQEKHIMEMSATDNYPYQLFFSTLSINNESIDPVSHPDIIKNNIAYTSSLKLNHNQNNISISFASPDFMHANSIVYEYILEGLDQQWTTTTDKLIRYTSLAPGNYQLKVREADNKHHQISLNIEITPPFYMSIWAYIIYAILIISLLIYIVSFMQRNALLRASLQLEHREKVRMEEMNQMKLNFFTNISHEFRTPLTLITSQIDLTLGNMNLSPSVKNKILKIKKHTKEMLILIDELMHFNKLEQGTFPLKVSKQDITAFLNDIFLSFKEYAQIKNITYNFEHTNEEIEVWFDTLQLKKVIYNILSNAFKFTDNDGTIILKLKQKKDCVLVSVIDNGIGIKESELEKIFERFYQTNHDATVQWMAGMGIGLALSKSIMNMHHGDIQVESVAGEQTVFTIKLLLGDKHFRDEQKGDWSLDETMYMTESIDLNPDSEVQEEIITLDNDDSKPRILIIEDNEELLQLLTQALNINYNILYADNGEEGLKKAIEYRPNLIISDVMIPRLSGLEICKRIKSLKGTSHIPIILLTARSSEKEQIEGLQCGADDYIIKPFNLDILLIKCNNLIKSRKELQLKISTVSDTEIEKSKLATNTIDQKFLDEAINVVEKHISNSKFDSNIWAKELSIGRSKLFHKIKEITGSTPNEYLIIIRMEKAATLLKNKPNMTIAEIAYEVGFSTPGYFSKCFKDQFGITPLQYRNS